jgi:hypothetical protein
MRPMIRDLIIFLAAAVAGSSATAGALYLLRSPTRGLPFRDNFPSGDDSQWVAYDGNWNVHGGVMVNESNERGAKLITGSPYWTDYALDADIALNTSGDAGVIARVSDAEPGVDAYSGIYGGLRVRDEALVLGVADHGWAESAAKPMPDPILPNSWYHIRMELRGCRIGLFAQEQGRSEEVSLGLLVPQCPVKGKIGLRSYDSGGKWKNVRVTMLK